MAREWMMAVSIKATKLLFNPRGLLIKMGCRCDSGRTGAGTVARLQMGSDPRGCCKGRVKRLRRI